MFIPEYYSVYIYVHDYGACLRTFEKILKAK